MVNLNMPYTDKEEERSSLSSDFDSDHDDTIATFLAQKKSKPWYRKWWLWVVLLVCLISTTISVSAMLLTVKTLLWEASTTPDLGDVPLLTSPSHHTSPATTSSTMKNPATADCGSSIESAREAGCILDIMLGGWVPPLCHNQTMALEALNYTQNKIMNAAGEPGPFTWYTDSSLETVIEAESLVEHLKTLPPDDMTVYTEPKYHLGHCLYRWQIVHMAAVRSLAGEHALSINDAVVGLKHSDHCREEILMNFKYPSRESRTLQTFLLFKCVPFHAV